MAIRMLIYLACTPIVLFGFFWGVLANERRLARRPPAVRDASDGERWRSVFDAPEVSPEECTHDDVEEDWNPAIEHWHGALQPHAPVILDQGGVCRTCGAWVIRHGSPYAWSEWLYDPTLPNDQAALDQPSRD